MTDIYNINCLHQTNIYNAASIQNNKKTCLECDEFDKEQINFEYNYKLQNYYDSINDISENFEQELNEELLFQFYDEENNTSDTDSENSVLDIDMETNLEDVLDFDVSNFELDIYNKPNLCN